MAEELYTYAVARIRSKEMTLFTKQTIDQLMSCKTYEDCLKSLYDRELMTAAFLGNSPFISSLIASRE